MILNSSNIEKLVLLNSEITNVLTNLVDEINQWRFGQLYPKLKPLAQKAKIDILNKLTKNDLNLIQKHLNLPSLDVEKLDYSIIKNHNSTIYEIEKTLNDNDDVLLGNFCFYRNGDSIYISSWR